MARHRAALAGVARQTERLLTLHDAISLEILGLDGDVKRAARGNPVVQQLTTLPGVGIFGALFLQAEIGSIDRVRSSSEARFARISCDSPAGWLGRYAAVHLSDNGVSTNSGIDRARTRHRRGV